jgi:hypothetical protein
MSSPYDFEAYSDRVNARFLELTGRVIALEAKVNTLTLQVQRLADAQNLELPYKAGEPERRG